MRFLTVLITLLFAQSASGFQPAHRKSVWSKNHRLINKQNAVRGEFSLAAVKTGGKESSSTLINNKEDVVEISAAPPNSYVQFAQTYPYANNLMIATAKTAAADLLAQTVIGGTPLLEIDVERSFLFCLFGCFYLGAFQYLYQVQIFKRLFTDMERFTQQSVEEKLRDPAGLKALAGQTVLDLTVLTAIYLPTFYIFKASVFSGSMDPTLWVSTGVNNFQTNFAKDEWDLLRVWLPADLVCFSVPLYLRLPVRHVVSFVWTAYLSFARGGH